MPEVQLHNDSEIQTLNRNTFLSQNREILGVIILGIVAIILVIALLQERRRYDELLAKMR